MPDMTQVAEQSSIRDQVYTWTATKPEQRHTLLNQVRSLPDGSWRVEIIRMRPNALPYAFSF